MPDAPPEVVMIQQVPPDYSLQTPWEARAARFRMLSSRSGLIGGCDPGRPGEIVVCAPMPERPYEGPQFVREGPIGDQIGDKLHVRIGRAELGSVVDENGERSLGLRLRF